VFRVERGDKSPVAIKIFHGDTLSNLIHYVLTGAPNPYIWNEDAIQAAYHRRRVLAHLIRAWFGERLDIADASAVRWNRESRAWELEAQFVPGGEVPLLHPFRPEDPTLDELVHRVMRPFQARLREAGLDGVVWQAGLGNPVALNNYLVLSPVRFSLIDAESGVPALFPLNPLPLLTFYLPRSWHHRQALFDHIDVPRLRRYLRDQSAALGFSEAEWQALRHHVEQLEYHQGRWQHMSRTARAVEYQRLKGRLTDEQALFYLARPVRWKLRETRRAEKKAMRLILRLPLRLFRWLQRYPWRDRFRQMGLFVRSHDYRETIARDYVQRRLDDWERRQQMSPDHAARLRQDLEQPASAEASHYLSDFGVHLGLKATFQLVEVIAFSVLVAAGVLPLWVLGLILALDGLIYRTAYTLYRIAHAFVRRRRRPWFALLVGLVPLLGSLAFPAQMVYSVHEHESQLGRFIIYDTLTRLGRKIPIWGGQNTLTEHRFNRFAHWILRRRRAET
jgi:hypothetical protein